MGRRYHQGKTEREIAVEFERGRRTVQRALDREGVERREAPQSVQLKRAQQVSFIVELAERIASEHGYTLAEIQGQGRKPGMMDARYAVIRQALEAGMTKRAIALALDMHENSVSKAALKIARE